MAKRFHDQSPDAALSVVLAAVTSYTAEGNVETYSALMTSVTQYGRACAQAERAEAITETEDVKRRVDGLFARELERSDANDG